MAQLPRYNLRNATRLQEEQTKPSRHALQELKDKHGLKVKPFWPRRYRRGGRWPHSVRVPHTSRGIQRGTAHGSNLSFALASLQALMHLPQFLNLITDHNSGPSNALRNPCVPITPGATINYHLPSHPVTVLKDGPNGTGCTACALKHLAQHYWGTQDTTIPVPGGNAVPNPIPAVGAGHAIMEPIERLIDQVWPGIVTVQPAEFITVLLHCVAECTQGKVAFTEPTVANPHPPKSSDWHYQFSALFKSTYYRVWACANCRWDSGCLINVWNDVEKQDPEPPAQLLNGLPQPGVSSRTVLLTVDAVANRESIETAIGRFIPNSRAVDPNVDTCVLCPAGRNHLTECDVITGAADCLFIKINPMNSDKNGNTWKRRRVHDIPLDLDLTRFQNTLTNIYGLKYKLSSVISHRGANLTTGDPDAHYIATVRRKEVDGVPYVSVIDDDNVQEFSGVGSARGVVPVVPHAYETLTDNQQPDHPTYANYQAVLLVYERVRGTDYRTLDIDMGPAL